MIAKFKLPISKEGSTPKKEIDELILSLYPVQIRRVLIPILPEPSQRETAPSVILKITTIFLS